MLNSEPIAVLKERIKSKERKLASSFQADKRIALFEIIRAMDMYFWYVLSLKNDSAKQEETSERSYLHQFGSSKVLSLFVGEHCINKGAPLFQSTKELQQWAEAVIGHSGYLGLCEMIIDLARYGLVELLMPSDTEIRVVLKTKHVGIELIEKEEFDILGKLAVEMDEKERSIILHQRKKMIKRMSTFVKPWRQHYIQYETAPDIDAFYEKLGLLWIRSNCITADSFPGEATFGGLPYYFYKVLVVTMVSWTLKHIDFCQALWEKHPSLELRNTLTITRNYDLQCGYLSDALDVRIEEVAQALSTLTLTPSNKSFHLSSPRTYIPPVIQISSDSIVCPLAGMLSGGTFYFMLAELRRQFPQDWDRAVNAREDLFRNDLRFLFPGKHIFIAKKSIKIKIGKRTLTDIDAVVFDQQNGTLGLFQLKWQDPFGTSMQKRETKKGNILAETNSWIDRVSSWLLDKEPDEIAQAFSLEQFTKIKVSKVLLFILGRYYVHFSGDEPPDSRAAWGMWPQVLRLLKESLEVKTYDGSDPLGWLHTKLLNESPFLKTRPELKQYEFELEGLKVVLDPLI